MDISANKTILAFQIKRGGKFNNGGCLHFLGEREEGIHHYTDDLFLRYGNEDKYRSLLEDRNAQNLLDKFDKCSDSKDFSWFEDKFFWDFGVLQYYTDGGYPVGLTFEEAESKIGTIDIDGDYNTVYTTFSDQLSEAEANALKNRGCGFFGLNIEDIEMYYDNIY